MSERPSRSIEADLLVVGSGAGGAPTAALAAEAGLDVVVVEEGGDVRQGEVVPFSLDQMERQYRNAGVTAALGRPSIAYTEGCCVGGGTEINSGLYRRPPPSVLAAWAERHSLPEVDEESIGPICDEIESALSVQRLPGEPTAASAALERGAANLGWERGEIPRWMRYEGTAATTGRRQGMTETYLPRATAAGATVISGTRVERLTFDGRRAIGAIARDRTGRIDIRCGAIVVAAGAIHTPALLQRSGHRRGIGSGLAVHPTVKLAARFPDAPNVADDVPVHQVTEFAPELSFGGSASSPGLIALALTDHWDRFGAAIADWRNMAVYYSAITSEGRGRVQAIPGFADPLVTYRLTRRDRQLLGRGLARLALVLLEAGATEVFPSFRGAPIVRERRDLAACSGAFSVAAAPLMTVHLCSTVPLDGDEGGAIDAYGRMRAADNVFVNDASLLPDAPGVNPQATVMAVAIRNVRHHLDRGHYGRRR